VDGKKNKKTEKKQKKQKKKTKKTSAKHIRYRLIGGCVNQCFTDHKRSNE